MTLREALDRTLLLIRDEVGSVPADDVLLDALTGVTVALVADTLNLSTHSAQTALITAALLMARSGHQVSIAAPNVELVGPQPPLQPGRLVDSLLAVGRDLLPGVELRMAEANQQVDLAITLGDAAMSVMASRTIRINAGPWSGSVGPESSRQRWRGGEWPVGAMAAAAIGAMEAFKIAMHRLQGFALNLPRMQAQFADIRHDFTFELAKAGTPCGSNLEAVDFVSAGAISNAALYVLSRVPTIRLSGRLIEPDTAAISNSNRYMLMLQSDVHKPKAASLSERLNTLDVRLSPLPELYDGDRGISPSLGPRVLVGTDNIPARWHVQRAEPRLLVIGATTHWSAMASFHTPGLGCAQCLHQTDDPNDGPIATSACVSFWAGLLAATYLLRSADDTLPSPREQQIFLTPSRPENRFVAPVPVWAKCPTCQEMHAA